MSVSLAAVAGFCAQPLPQTGPIMKWIHSQTDLSSAWDVGLNLRTRIEGKNNGGFTDAGSGGDFSLRPQDDNDNTYLLTRVMPRIGFSGQPLGFLVEARSSYSFSDERFRSSAPGNGLPERDGPLDLHQAFVTLTLSQSSPIRFKLGRQELALGEQRLVGPLRWNNTLRTFDAFKAQLQGSGWGADVFTGGVVYSAHRRLNRSTRHDRFSGMVLNFKPIAPASPSAVIEGYLLARNTSRKVIFDDWSRVSAPFRFPAPQDVYSLGIRVKSTPSFSKTWDYGWELIGQTGNRTLVVPATSVATALTAPRLDHRAYAMITQIGYTLHAVPFTPRVALIYSHASGDRDSTDNQSTTFQNLFPTNHLFYGVMDMNSLQNLQALRTVLTFKPKSDLSLTFELHGFKLEHASDYWYNVAGVPRSTAAASAGLGNGFALNPQYSPHLGIELDAAFAWNLRPYLQLEGAVSRFFRGAYIRDSLRQFGSKDATYTYLQLTFNL